MVRLSPHRAVSAALILAAALTVAGCFHDDDDAPRYRAEVRYTAYGIPHVRAGDWEGLGYGYGYAFAADNPATPPAMFSATKSGLWRRSP